jgi:hypothetical protein
VLPDDVLAQICHQIYVSGLDHIHYAVRIGGNEYRQGVVRADEEADTIRYVISKADAYRSSYLAGRFENVADPETGVIRSVWRGAEREPEWEIGDRAASLIELDGLLHPERAEKITVEDVGAVMGLAQARARKNEADKAEQRAKAAVLREANGARWVTTSTDSGEKLAYEFAPRDRSRVNLDILRERYPAAYHDPEVVTHSTSWQINIAEPFKVKNVPEETPEES